MIAVVIYSTTVECRECRSGGNKLSNARSFIILRSGEGLTSFNENTMLTFMVKSTMKLSEMSNFLKDTKKFG